MTNTSIQLYPSPNGSRLLPSITICPLPSFKTRGKFYNVAAYLNNTFGIEDIFEEETMKQLLHNTTFYEHKEVFTLLTGRCHRVS